MSRWLVGQTSLSEDLHVRGRTDVTLAVPRGRERWRRCVGYQVPRSCGPPGPSSVERATGIEPAPSVWKTEALPLSYARVRPENRTRPTAYPMPAASARPYPAAAPLRRSRRFGDLGVSGPHRCRNISETAGTQRADGATAARPGWGGGMFGALGDAPAAGCRMEGIDCSSPRGVAQLGSALALGARGRGFKSRHPDSLQRGAGAPGTVGERDASPRGSLGAAGRPRRFAYTRWAEVRPESTEIRQGVRL